MKILLLSGLLCDETVWREIIPELQTHGDVFPMHFQGVDSLVTMAESVLSTHTGQLAVAGHSMGARVALEMFRLAPDRLRGLALLNTGVHGVRDGEFESRRRLVRLAADHGMYALADEWLPPMMGDDPTVSMRCLPSLREMVARNTPEQFAAQIRALLGRQEATTLLSTINVPTLLMSGTADRWSPLDQHALMRDAIAGSRLVSIPHGGHMAPVEYPVEVTRSLLSWLERVPTAQ
jgi:pimeloyl-ACP methyl ester carboxylesterase